MRIAMIGAGAMANQVHYPSLAAFADVEIAAIADLDPTRLQSTADKYNVTGRYSDYRQMIETVAPDAVYAIGQPHLMFDIWLWCLQPLHRKADGHHAAPGATVSLLGGQTQLYYPGEFSTACFTVGSETACHLCRTGTDYPCQLHLHQMAARPFSQRA